MAQTIRIKRNVTSAVPPPTLDPGELAYMKNGQKLYVGDDTNTVNNLVSADRQLEIHANSPPQAIDPLAGAKTFPIAKIKIPGGVVGEMLSLTNVDGTLGYAPVVSASQQFVGSAKGDTGLVQLTTAAGGGTALPAPTPANSGWYVIYDVAGAVPPPASGVPGPFNVGDWLISNGTAWTHLAYGGISTVTAADVGVVAPVTGGSNVQAVLESMQVIDAGHDTAIAANAAAIVALEAADAAQDTLIDTKITKPAAVAAVGNIATFADTGGLAALDGGVTIAQLQASITAKGDVVGPAGAVADNIAVFDTATGKLIKDGTTSVTAINAAIAANTAAIALKADTAALANYLPLAGGTVTGPIILPVAAPTTDPEAANKKYVDDQIGTIPGATPPGVTAPELTGDGTTGNFITFTGITTEPLVFSGKGLSTDPLLLLLVDGGTWT